MSDDETYSFKTGDERLLYIEKNAPNSNDNIISANSNLEDKQILFSSKDIKLFDKNKDYLVVVLNNDDTTNDIVALNLNTKVQRRLNLKDILVSRVSLSQKSNIFAYTS